MTVLLAQHLQKTIKKKLLVRDVSLSLKQGEIVGLLGPNGAGKTTTFYLMVGLLPCDKGCITLVEETDEKDITYWPIHVRARAGITYLPQEPSIFRKLTVSDNILAILECRSDLCKKIRQEELEVLLDQFQLSAKREQMGFTLSGGERRRTEMARAMATNPKFLFLDEPFAGVDPIAVLEIKHTLEELRKRNIGILITDHNVRETLSLCQRAYILHQGTVLTQGNPSTILADPMVREVYLGNKFMI